MAKLVHTTTTGDHDAQVAEHDEPHCFVCGRHTDHFAEHDDLVEQGLAEYQADGSVVWTAAGQAQAAAEQAADDAAFEAAADAERRAELLYESPALYDPAYADELERDRQAEQWAAPW